LSYYNIQEESILHLALQSKMNIFVETFDGKSIPIEVECGNTFEQIKKRILDIEGIPVDNQQCFCKDLENDSTLIENIINGSTIHLILNI
jgi:hypothetical protein